MQQAGKEVYANRYPLRALLEAEIKSKISQTRLGALWWIMDPLIQFCIYFFLIYIIFQRGGPDYPMLIFSGLVVWDVFAKGLTQSASTFSRNSVLIRAYNIPLFIYILAPALVGLFYALFGFTLLLIFNYENLGLHTLAIVPLSVLLCMATLAFALPVAIFGAWFKDVSYGIGYLLRLCMYTTPVIYSMEMLAQVPRLPEWAKFILMANPMAYIINSFRAVIMHSQWPDLLGFLVWFVILCVLIEAGLLLLRYAHNTLPKVI